MARESHAEVLVERLVDLLANGMDGAHSRELADELGISRPAVTRLLVDLESRGIVTRTGRTRATRWWLG